MEEKIVKKDGYVYRVILHDVYGKHKTITKLGKDPAYWEAKEKKSKKSED